VARAQAARAVTNIFAFKFGVATYVQLLGLTAPFFVAVLQWVVLREPVPPRFYAALACTVVGSVLMLSDDIGHLDFATVTAGTNLLGMGLAVVSALFLAAYMVLVRMAFRERLPLAVTLAVQVLSMAAIGLVLMPAEGDVAQGWQQWRSLTAGGWAAFFTISLGVYALGNILSYLVLDWGGAAYNASLMGLRLVVTVAGSALLLGERLTSAWQGVGMAVVIAGLAYFALGGRNAPPLVQASTQGQGAPTSPTTSAPAPAADDADEAAAGPALELQLLADTNTIAPVR
jgi:drug/metabolite transporter (DMT)-like permease